MQVGTRITLATSALVTVTLGVYAFFDLRTANSDRRSNIEDEARNVALSLRASLETRSLADIMEQAPTIAKHLAKSATDWRVEILPATSMNAPEVKSNAARLKRMQTLIDLPDVHLMAEEDDVLIYAVGLRAPPRFTDIRPRAAAVLEVSRPIAHLEKAFYADLVRTLLLIGIILAVTILALVGLTRSLMTRPVAKLLAGMDDVAHGDLSHVLLSERDDEIGDLATRFNEMTYSLRESRAETQRQNEAKLELEQRLGQTEKLATIGQLAAEIAHEVGTPLGVIAGRSRTLTRKAKDPAAVEKNAKIISEQTARITRIIQRLLDFTRRKVGVSEPATVDLDELALSTMELLQGKLTSANIKHSLVHGEGVPPVKGDPDRLQQVFLNLVLNAVQAMPDGGTVALETKRVTRRRPGLEADPEHEYTVVEIRDTGQGIPPERRDKIFEPFYTSKQDDGGTGLGLAVCYGIVKEHDGWIELHDAPVSGTVFAIYLPAAESAAE